MRLLKPEVCTVYIKAFKEISCKVSGRKFKCTSLSVPTVYIYIQPAQYLWLYHAYTQSTGEYRERFSSLPLAAHSPLSLSHSLNLFLGCTRALLYEPLPLNRLKFEKLDQARRRIEERTRRKRRRCRLHPHPHTHRECALLLDLSTSLFPSSAATQQACTVQRHAEIRAKFARRSCAKQATMGMTMSLPIYIVDNRPECSLSCFVPLWAVFFSPWSHPVCYQ